MIFDPSSRETLEEIVMGLWLNMVQELRPYSELPCDNKDP